MKLAILCDQGTEEFCAQDVRRILGREAQCGKQSVRLEASVEEAALLNYHLLTGSRVIAVLHAGASCVPELFASLDLTPFLPAGGSFKVVARKDGAHARELEEAFGAVVHERGHPVDLVQPDATLIVWWHGEECLLGVDLSGRDLGKREYRAFTTRKSLRSTIIASALFASGRVGQRLADPYGSDGTVVIEAALAASTTSPQRYKKEFAFLRMPFAQGVDWQGFFREQDEKHSTEVRVWACYPLVGSLKMGRANAKLAGVEDLIVQTKCELRWFSEKLKDLAGIVTIPPVSSKHLSPRSVEPVQEELFAEARRALVPGGTVLLIAEKKAELLNPAARHGFRLAREWAVQRGGAQFFFLSFEAPE